jgi:VanZ family protein
VRQVFLLYNLGYNLSIMRHMKFFLPSMVWAGLIYWGSSFPMQELPKAKPYLSYGVHFFEFMVLGYFLAMAAIRVRPNFQEAFAWAVFFGLSYSFIDELHQSFVPGRSVELADLAIDFVGGVIGVLTYGFFRKERKGTEDSKLNLPHTLKN